MQSSRIVLTPVLVTELRPLTEVITRWFLGLCIVAAVIPFRHNEGGVTATAATMWSAKKDRRVVPSQ